MNDYKLTMQPTLLQYVTLHNILAIISECAPVINNITEIYRTLYKVLFKLAWTVT